MTRPARRFEDRMPGVVMVISRDPDRPDGSSCVSIVEYDGASADGAAEERDSVVMVDPGADEVFVLTAAEMQRRVALPAGGLGELAACEARAMRDRRLSARRRRRFSSGFVTFAERMNRATSEDEAGHVLVDCVAELLDAHAAVLYLRPDGAAGALAPVPHSYRRTRLLPLDPSALPLPGPEPVYREQTRPGAPLAALDTLFSAGAAHLACAPVSDRGILVVLDRRTDRSLGGEDWFRLQTCARHAGRTFERLAFAAQLGRNEA